MMVRSIRCIAAIFAVSLLFNCARPANSLKECSRLSKTEAAEVLLRWAIYGDVIEGIGHCPVVLKDESLIIIISDHKLSKSIIRADKRLRYSSVPINIAKTDRRNTANIVITDHDWSADSPVFRIAVFASEKDSEDCAAATFGIELVCENGRLVGRAKYAYIAPSRVVPGIEGAK